MVQFYLNSVHAFSQLTVTRSRLFACLLSAHGSETLLLQQNWQNNLNIFGSRACREPGSWPTSRYASPVMLREQNMMNDHVFGEEERKKTGDNRSVPDLCNRSHHQYIQANMHTRMHRRCLCMMPSWSSCDCHQGTHPHLPNKQTHKHTGVGHYLVAPADSR